MQGRDERWETVEVEGETEGEGEGGGEGGGGGGEEGGRAGARRQETEKKKMLPVPVILPSLGGEEEERPPLLCHTTRRAGEQAEVEGSGCEILITSLCL